MKHRIASGGKPILIPHSKRGEADFIIMIQGMEHLQTLVQAELDTSILKTLINHTLGQDLSCSVATCCHNSDKERTHICRPQQ